MPETLTSPLLEAATETFESLAYLFAEPGITDDIPGEDVEGVVAVAFSGPSHGGVIMQLSGGVLPALAANMLGLDDPTSGHDQRDALGEAANVICGNVLPRVAGSAAVFALGSHSCSPAGPTPSNPSAPSRRGSGSMSKADAPISHS